MANLNNDFSLRITFRPDLELIFRIMRHIGFVPPRGDYYKDIGDWPYKSKLFGSMADTVFFSSLFLDGHICFKMEQDHKFTKREMSYILPMGPVVLTDVVLTANNHRLISWEIASKTIQMYYNTYREKQLEEVFIEKQLNLINNIEKLIEDFVENDKSIPTEMKRWLISKLIIQSRIQFITKHKAIGGLRDQFENFLESKDLDLDLIFSTPNPGRPINNYHIKVFLDNFMGSDVISWGSIDRSLKDLARLKLNKVYKENVPNIVRHLVSVIDNIDGKKVKIFPLYSSTYDGYKGMVSGREFLPSQGVFEIDLSNPRSNKYKEGIYILTHIAMTMHSYPITYIMKESTGTYDDKKIICAFDFQGYIRMENLFSRHSRSSTGRIFYVDQISNVFIDPNNPGSYINFYDKLDYYQDLWDKSWKYHIGLTTGRDSEFLSYMNTIKAGFRDFNFNLVDLGDFTDYANFLETILDF